MCGRYVVPKMDGLASLFDIDLLAENLPEPTFNARPSFSLTDPEPPVPVIVEAIADDDQLVRRMEPGFWSYIPSWAKELPRNTFNAVSEEAASKPTWKASVKSKRCVVPAAAYYEAGGRGKSAYRYAFAHPNEEVLPLAGLWGWWRPSPDAPWLLTFAILTIPSPTPEIAAVHHRSPLVLDRELVDTWLDPRQVGDQAFLDMAAAKAADLVSGLRFWEVARLDVNSEEMLAPRVDASPLR